MRSLFIVFLFLSSWVYPQMDEPLFYDANHYPTEIKYAAYDSALNLQLFDGPYIWWNNKSNTLKIIYYQHTPSPRKTKRIISRLNVLPDDSITMFKGLFNDTNIYMIYKNEYVKKSEYKDIDKILVVGDLHGELERLIKILKVAGVIDDKGQWIFGNNTIVFTGDVVDRGDLVTETLWFIYSLEKQAMIHGGNVHFLLGNHEVMLFEKDTRYLNLKYYFFSQRYNRSYYSNFTGNSVLGKWLKNQNSIIIINDILFVHAGISPEIAKSNLTVSQMNQIIRNYIEKPEKYKNDSSTLLVLGASGPLWYRGYLARLKDFYPRIQPDEIEMILNRYGISKIIFGHTGLSEITPLFDNKLIDIDVPFKEYTLPVQVLLIEKNKFYKIKIDGSKSLLFE